MSTFFRFKMYSKSTVNGYFFVEFSNEVSNAELQQLLPVLNKTAWYKDYGNFNLLEFTIKSKEKNTTKQGIHWEE